MTSFNETKMPLQMQRHFFIDGLPIHSYLPRQLFLRGKYSA